MSFLLSPSILASGSLRQSEGLPKAFSAPELVGISSWLNSSTPLTLKNLQGKVVLLDFWTYSCINCIRTFPHIEGFYQKYKDQGLVIIGIHSPEFEFEKDANNVKKALDRYHITYPIALDNDFKTWHAYENHYWPAHYLIDQQGFVRYRHFGEGNYLETENAIRSLLGLSLIEKASEPLGTFRRTITPETYLGYLRADRYTSNTKIQKGKDASYSGSASPSSDEVSLTGTWLVGPESIDAKNNGASLYLNFYAKKVHLVMSGPPKALVTLLLDGKILPKTFRTDDMNDKGEITIDGARKYDLVDLKHTSGRHTLQLKFPEGVSAYAFTFGDE